MNLLFLITLVGVLIAVFSILGLQTPSYRKSEGRVIHYTPASAVYPGDVIVLGSLVCISPLAIDANTQGEVATDGLFSCPKDASVFAAGDPIYWNATGNPTGGTAGSGCFTSTASGNTFAGTAAASVATGVATVDVKLAGTTGVGTESGISAANVKYSTAALSGSTASAGQLTGAAIVVMNNSGATPGTYTTRTAAQMFADIPNCQIGSTYLLILTNGQATGTLTLAGGTGVTITGTATVAANTSRTFVVTITSATAIGIQNVGSGVAP